MADAKRKRVYVAGPTGRPPTEAEAQKMAEALADQLLTDRATEARKQ